MPGDWHPEKSEDGLNEDGHQHKIARSAEHRRGVGEDEGADNITRRLLRHTQQRGQRNLFRLTLEYFQDGHAFNAFFVEHLLKDRGLADTEPDPRPIAAMTMLRRKGIRHPQTRNWSPENQLKNSTARFARNSPAGPPNCGQAARKPRFLLVRAHSIASNTEPPHSPPTPIPWIRRIITKRTAPQMPMLS
jgi:hypothetical protein